MSKYRKKPVVIEAMRLWPENIAKVEEWIGPASIAKGAYIDPANQIAIYTLEGVMTANSGDWIIKGVKGEFYPCKHDIFDATYEYVSQ
jgi:hypothetical protein